MKAAPLLKRFGDWRAYLAAGLSEEEHETLRSHERTGRPLGSEKFIEKIEAKLGRELKKRKPGPKKAPAGGKKSPKAGKKRR